MRLLIQVELKTEQTACAPQLVFEAIKEEVDAVWYIDRGAGKESAYEVTSCTLQESSP